MRGLGVVIGLGLSLALSACGSVAERPVAENLTLQPGLYKVVATQGTRAVWHDAVIVSAGQSQKLLESILPMFQGRMQPSNGASSWQATDRPCAVTRFKPEGGTFSASGECRILDAGLRTNFSYAGKAHGNGFTIAVERSGFGTRKAGTPDQIVISGTWEKDLPDLEGGQANSESVADSVNAAQAAANGSGFSSTADSSSSSTSGFSSDEEVTPEE
jgi:hypothetical protein